MTSLPTVTAKTSFEDIAKVIGQELPSENTGISTHLFLKINRDHEDDEGRSIPAGSWSITLPDKTVYAKEIDLQVFVQRYQYVHYDAEANEFVNKSILAKNLYPQTEVPDIMGTMRCGSVPASQREGLSADQALLQKSIKSFRMLYGKVSLIDAVDHEGQKVDVGDLPVLWRARGSNFMPISVPLDSLSAQKKPFIFYKLRGSLEKKKNGGLVYYVAGFKVSEGPADFTPDDQSLLEHFMSNIDGENKQVMAEYDKALISKGDYIDAESSPVDISGDNALNDDLPEDMRA